MFDCQCCTFYSRGESCDIRFPALSPPPSLPGSRAWIYEPSRGLAIRTRVLYLWKSMRANASILGLAHWRLRANAPWGALPKLLIYRSLLLAVQRISRRRYITFLQKRLRPVRTLEAYNLKILSNLQDFIVTQISLFIYMPNFRSSRWHL